MRISITTEASIAAELADELRLQSGVEVESISDEQDLTEQAFGLVEVSAVIAIVRGAADLVGILRNLAHRTPSRSQTMTLKTAFGSVTLELSADATLEDLHQLVVPLFDPA